MKETNIDCMKYRKSSHLAGVDVEMIQLEKGKCILTIKEAFYQTNVNVSGNKTDGYFLVFEEDVKDMVVNSTNRKVIAEIVQKLKNIPLGEARNIGNWVGVSIELSYDETVEMMKKKVGGIRVVNVIPITKEEIIATIERCKSNEDLTNVYRHLYKSQKAEFRTYFETQKKKIEDGN